MLIRINCLQFFVQFTVTVLRSQIDNKRTYLTQLSC